MMCEKCANDVPYKVLFVQSIAKQNVLFLHELCIALQKYCVILQRKSI